MGNTAELMIRLDRLEREFDKPSLNPTTVYTAVVASGLVMFFVTLVTMFTSMAAFGK